jgi:hypothetical protein
LAIRQDCVEFVTAGAGLTMPGRADMAQIVKPEILQSGFLYRSKPLLWH